MPNTSTRAHGKKVEIGARPSRSALVFWPIELLMRTSRPGFDSSCCAQGDTGATATTGVAKMKFFDKQVNKT